MKLIPIIYIQWMDAHNNTGWFTDDDVDDWAKGDWYCNDVGYLIRETKRFLVFAQRHEPDGHANGQEQWGGLHRIPKTWVRSRRILGYLKHDGTLISVRGALVPKTAYRQASKARKGKPNGRRGT